MGGKVGGVKDSDTSKGGFAGLVESVEKITAHM